MENCKDLLIRLFDSYTPLSASSRQALLGSFQFVAYAKNSFIIRENKHDSYEYFLLEGIAHKFNISDNGENITTGFYYSPSVIVPHFARTKQANSIFSLQALNETIFAQIPVKVFDQLRQAHPDIRQFGQMVVEKELAKYLHDETTFRSCTAVQRLLMMRDAYPNLENMVPHNIIASFLGVTPVSFSRLRNNLASSK